MPCVDESGNFSEAALKLLTALSKNQLDSKAISSEVGVPLFKVRSSLRELVEAKLLEEIGEKFKLTDYGKTLLEKALKK